MQDYMLEMEISCLSALNVQLKQHDSHHEDLRSNHPHANTKSCDIYTLYM